VRAVTLEADGEEATRVDEVIMADRAKFTYNEDFPSHHGPANTAVEGASALIAAFAEGFCSTAPASSSQPSSARVHSVAAPAVAALVSDGTKTSDSAVETADGRRYAGGAVSSWTAPGATPAPPTALPPARPKHGVKPTTPAPAWLTQFSEMASANIAAARSTQAALGEIVSELKGVMSTLLETRRGRSRTYSRSRSPPASGRSTHRYDSGRSDFLRHDEHGRSDRYLDADPSDIRRHDEHGRSDRFSDAGRSNFRRYDEHGRSDRNSVAGRSEFRRHDEHDRFNNNRTDHQIGHSDEHGSLDRQHVTSADVQNSVRGPVAGFGTTMLDFD
jgi:hypothetical protein